MATQDIAAAMQRVQAMLRRRPRTGLHDDSQVIARWESGTRVVSHHPSGIKVSTDLPDELGGTGDQVTPGWLFRAGLASCTATTIAMIAAAEGIDLATLEVSAGSRSDTRGLFGMTEADGQAVPAGPRDLHLRVRIAAQGVEPALLRALVEEAWRRSPVPEAVENAVPIALHIDIA